MICSLHRTPQTLIDTGHLSASDSQIHATPSQPSHVTEAPPTTVPQVVINPQVSSGSTSQVVVNPQVSPVTCTSKPEVSRRTCNPVLGTVLKTTPPPLSTSMNIILIM